MLNTGLVLHIQAVAADYERHEEAPPIDGWQHVSGTEMREQTRAIR
jgi:hypothetical protein